LRGFSLKEDGVYLAKVGIVKPIWSRELPSLPSSVTVVKDRANRYFLSFVVEVEPVNLPAENQSVLNPSACKPHYRENREVSVVPKQGARLQGSKVGTERLKSKTSTQTEDSQTA